MDDLQNCYFPVKNYSSTKSSLLMWLQKILWDPVCAWNVILLVKHHVAVCSQWFSALWFVMGSTPDVLQKVFLQMEAGSQNKLRLNLNFTELKLSSLARNKGFGQETAVNTYLHSSLSQSLGSPLHGRRLKAVFPWGSEPLRADREIFPVPWVPTNPQDNKEETNKDNSATVLQAAPAR